MRWTFLRLRGRHQSKRPDRERRYGQQAESQDTDVLIVDTK